MPNMFDPHPDYVKVTRCVDCEKSYTPVTVPAGQEQPVVTARFCGLTNRIKRDDVECRSVRTEKSDGCPNCKRQMAYKEDEHGLP